MSRSQWEAISAVRAIAEKKKIKGLYGMVIELFTCNEKFNTAVEVTAGNQLFQMVVDTDDTAATLLKELAQANAGRVTFMPLNRIKPGADPKYPVTDDALPMMEKLTYDKKFRPAIAEIFRKGLIVKSIEVGCNYAKSHELDCVTIAGDQINRKGAMTGGWMEARRSRIGAQSDILRLQAEMATLEKKATVAANALVQVDQHVTTLLGELSKHDKTAQEATAAAELEAIDLPSASAAGGSSGGSSSKAAATKAADAQKEKAYAALVSAVESEKIQLRSIENEIKSDFTPTLTDGERKEVESLIGKLAELTKARDAASLEADRAESAGSELHEQLEEHLHKRQAELRSKLAQLDEEDAREEAGEAAGSSSYSGGGGSDRARRLEQAKAKLTAAEEAVEAAIKEREEKREMERSLQNTSEELKSKLANERSRQAEEAKMIDRIMTKRSLLQEKAEEFTSLIRKLGALPKDALDGMYAEKNAKALMSEIEKCHKELHKLGKDNKKALDQYAAYSEEPERLSAKQDEMDAAKEKIDELIEHLDHKKDEAIERTFKGVSLQFERCFKELVPGGWGKLIMCQHADLPDDASPAARVANYSGVSIKVQFPGAAVATSMNQLSGGQKTMVSSAKRLQTHTP